MDRNMMMTKFIVFLEVWWCNSQHNISRVGLYRTEFSALLPSIQNKKPSLCVKECCEDDTKCFAIIDRGLSLNSLLSTPISNPRMILTMALDPKRDTVETTYTFEAHFEPIKSGKVGDGQFNELIESLHPSSTYYLCEGIPQDVACNVTFDAKNLRKWGFPLHRTDHTQCLMWFHLEKVPLNLKYGVRCTFCSKLYHYLICENSRRQKVTIDQKAQRILPSSKCPVKYLSPFSKEKRHQLTRQELKSKKRKVQNYEQYNVNVGELSNEELLAIVTHIHHKSKADLSSLLTEADKVGKGDILREKWRQDVEDRLSFDRDQQKNGMCFNNYRFTLHCTVT